MVTKSEITFFTVIFSLNKMLCEILVTKYRPKRIAIPVVNTFLSLKYFILSSTNHNINTPIADATICFPSVKYIFLPGLPAQRIYSGNKCQNHL